MTIAGLSYRKEWSVKTGRPKVDVYVPKDIRTQWNAKRSDARFLGAVHYMKGGEVGYAEGFTTDDDPDVLDLVPTNAELFLKSELHELPPLDPEAKYEAKVKENNPRLWESWQEYLRAKTEPISFVDYVAYKYDVTR